MSDIEEYLELLEDGCDIKYLIKLIEKDYGIKCEEIKSGGSVKSTFIAKMVATNKFDIDKIKNPSAHLKDKYKKKEPPAKKERKTKSKKSRFTMKDFKEASVSTLYEGLEDIYKERDIYFDVAPTKKDILKSLEELDITVPEYLELLYQRVHKILDEKERKQQGKGIGANDLNDIMQQGYLKDKNKMKNINGYVLDRELSGQRVQVYYNKDTNDVLINHRGTADLKDWGTDLLMTLGVKTNRFKHAKTIQDVARIKYKGANVISTGHSLGSALAKHASKKNDEIISVNGAYLPQHMVSDKKFSKLTNVKSKGDVVNALHYVRPKNETHKNVVIDSKGNFLKQHGTDNLKKLNNKYLGY